jgi:hypothetical protein
MRVAFRRDPLRIGFRRPNQVGARAVSPIGAVVTSAQIE